MSNAGINLLEQLVFEMFELFKMVSIVPSLELTLTAFGISTKIVIPFSTISHTSAAAAPYGPAFAKLILNCSISLAYSVLSSIVSISLSLGKEDPATVCPAIC